MFKNISHHIKEKLKESLKSVLPVFIIVLLLCFFVPGIEVSVLTSFIFGTVLVVVGTGIFNLGADMSMTPMGGYVGAQMTKSKKIWLIIILSFFVGVLITMSEPDLQILASHASINPSILLTIAVSIGVGAFLVLAMLRIIFAIKLKYLLIGFYILVFVLAFFVDKGFWSVAFDSGGVTTGPMTVPFIIALGVGVSSIRSDSQENNDSFGLVALCSVGPIMSVLVLGLILGGNTGDYEYLGTSIFDYSQQLGLNYLTSLPHYFLEVLKSVLPIAAFFFIYQLFAGRLNKTSLLKIVIGLIYTIVGLVLFLTGANVGFMAAGSALGEIFGKSEYVWIVIPIGMIVGFFIVAAEPAVQVLQAQVENVTSGAIPKKALAFALEIGVAISVGIAMLRAITGVSIMIPLIIGYSIALILTFFVPEIFTSIAFDSGGVASGAMTSTFLLSFSVGVCYGVNGNTESIMTDAFGTVAMVAMTPLIAIQILGIVYKIRIKKIEATKKAEEEAVTEAEEIISVIEAPLDGTLTIPIPIEIKDEIIDF
ncbi:MAG: DUF1538 domain-containing protein [Clostridia bacterium]|nr:DUF1538 domain-containing protein [Clostridia bacterium]